MHTTPNTNRFDCLSMEIIQSQDSIYRSEIIELYVEVFSSGLSKQQIDLKELNSRIDAILVNGYALLALENSHIIGAILCCPLQLDKLLPEKIHQNFSIEKCVYVAEMMVSASSRGRGIGSKLMIKFFETVDRLRYTDAFIRVWDENIPALNLYHKMGFEPVASIQQTKKKADGNGNFVMNKIYLHKKLD